MTFPERPTCHGKDSMQSVSMYGAPTWRAANELPERPFRSCSFCGSMHPEDLILLFEGKPVLPGYPDILAAGQVAFKKALEETQDQEAAHQAREAAEANLSAGTGPKLGGADHKYGFPHKLYVEGINNPKFGQIVEIGKNSWFDPETKTRKDEPIMGEAPRYLTGKWYTNHIGDKGFDDKALKKLLEILSKHSGIIFSVDEKGVKYNAPYHNFQH